MLQNKYKVMCINCNVQQLQPILISTRGGSRICMLVGLEIWPKAKNFFTKDVSESSKFNIDVDEVEYYNLKVRRQETIIKSGK